MIQIIIFLGLCAYFFWLGSRFNETGNIKVFLYSAVLLPLAPSLAILHFRYQINAYAFFVVIPLLLFFFNIITRNKFNKKTFRAYVVLIGFALFYFLISDILNDKEPTLVNYLKDLKPLILIGIGFTFLLIMDMKQVSWSDKFSKRLLGLNFYLSSIYYLLLNNTEIISIIARDRFYEISDVRYLSLGTFFALFYLMAKLSNDKALSMWEFIFILTPIFISGNRTLFFILFNILLIKLLFSITNVRRFLTWLVLIFSGLLILVFGIINFSQTIKNRLLSALDFNLIKAQFLEYRFAPFNMAISEFEWYNFIFGKGIGETFFIPWFVWRVHVDNYNIYMDNLYLTLYVKYGVFSLIIYVIIFIFINSINSNKKFKIFVLTYFFCIGFTTAFIYQYTFLFIILLLTIFKTQPSNPDLC